MRDLPRFLDLVFQGRGGGLLLRFRRPGFLGRHKNQLMACNCQEVGSLMPFGRSSLRQGAAAANAQIRAAWVQAQSVDKGFDRFIRHFKPERPVAVTLWVEEGLHNEMGRAVYVQQGNRTWLLTGRTYDRSKPEASPRHQ
jgi:hypothetical protein